MSRSSWLIAFADLAAVLVGFFVLMLSMSEFDVPAVEELLDRLGRMDGEWMAVNTVNLQPEASLLRGDEADITDIGYLATVLRTRAREAGWPVHVRKGDSSVVLTVKDGGARDLSVEAADALESLGRYLGLVGYRVEVAIIYPESRAERALGFGVYDTGLAAAGEIVNRMHAGGLDGIIPIVNRIGRGAQDTRREIHVALDLPGRGR